MHTLSDIVSIVDFIKERVKAVAMLNSVHSKNMINEGGPRSFMFDNCVNWVSSEVKKGQTVQDLRFGCTCISSEVEIADFTLTEMLDDFMKFIFIKMGDIEVPDEEDDDDEDLKLSKEEIEEHLENVTVLDSMD